MTFPLGEVERGEHLQGQPWYFAAIRMSGPLVTILSCVGRGLVEPAYRRLYQISIVPRTPLFLPQSRYESLSPAMYSPSKLEV